MKVLSSDVRDPDSSWIVLRGPLDSPCDGIQEYLLRLRDGLRVHGRDFCVAVLQWAEGLGLVSFWNLWKASRGWRRRVVLLEYTPGQWGQRNFPFWTVPVLLLLRWRKVRLLLHFQEVLSYPVLRARDTLRVMFQWLIVRVAFALSPRVIMMEDPRRLGSRFRGLIHPSVGWSYVGSNVHGVCERMAWVEEGTRRTIAIFCMTEGVRGRKESALLGRILSEAARTVGTIHVIVFGRGACDAEAHLRAALQGTAVTLEIHGLLPPGEIHRLVGGAHLMMNVRQAVRNNLTTIVTGIACGVPILGFREDFTGPPITRGGVCLVPNGDEKGMTAALVELLQDASQRHELRLRSRRAYEQYFRWEVIAEQMIRQVERPLREAGRSAPHFEGLRDTPGSPGDGRTPVRTGSARSSGASAVAQDQIEACSGL